MKTISSIQAFRDFINGGSLVDLGYEGSMFTWSNKQAGINFIRERLDRCLASIQWKQNYPNGSVVHLDDTGSDHRPLLVSSYRGGFKTKRRFRFQERWCDSEEARHNLVAWQKNLSTNLKKNIAELNSKLNAEKDKGAGADTTMIRVLEVKPEDEYEREKRFWKEKARLQWGDKNTKFFHAKFRMRSSKNKLHRLESDSGEVGTNPEQIASIAQQYFKNLFTTSKPKEPTEELEGLTRRVDNNTNRRLTRPVSDQEIKDAVFSINPLVAPGEDGFTAKFYQFFWDTIKRDVLNAVHSFFEGGKMLRAFNHTHICLIPKDSNISKMN
ncbi:uncharacterized protein [Arachis hypogaea]|uniref:uncharacterized protein n=1 Tax=Arachis hypogaea TaxID=3818 RepID=UPI003B2165CA